MNLARSVIKERYCGMRGYKKKESAEGVSRFLAWAGNYLGRGRANLTILLNRKVWKEGVREGEDVLLQKVLPQLATTKIPSSLA